MAAGYETNIEFRAPEIDDFGGAINGSLGRGWQWPRGQLSFSMQGTGVRYFSDEAAPRGNGSAGLSWSQQLSPKVTFSLGGYGSGGTTTSQAFVDDIGQVLPRSRVLYYGGSTGLAFRLGRHSSFEVGGGYGRVDFDDPTLVSTHSVIGSASLSKQVGINDNLSLTYGYRSNEDQNRRPLDFHTCALGWSRTLSRHFSMSLSAGAGYNPQANDPVNADALAQEWYFIGSAGLSATWKHTTLSFRVGQSATPTYGFGGSQLTDAASLSTVFPFGRRVQLGVSAGHSQGRSLSGDRNPHTSDSGTLTLGIVLGRQAGLEIAYNYRRSKTEGEDAIDAQRGYFGFTYRFPSAGAQREPRPSAITFMVSKRMPMSNSHDMCLM